MKTKINEPQKTILTNYQSHLAITQEKHDIDHLLAKLLTQAKIGQLLQERKDGNYTAIPKKRIKVAKRLRAMINDAYGDKMHLVRTVDECIKLVSLNMEEENVIGNEQYPGLLFFLFTFKEALQNAIDNGNLISELSDFVYGLFGRKDLIEDIDKWIRFVTLCTDKENYTGSEEYLELINFLYIFKDALQNKKSS